ncbi:flagella basal body P-ring formation protein FlgA [Inhella inkyongensis]|uniref:Flagella basal body P-ring formation protein FlgA n=1 Tax=Inhella inkyongensis TaxID=392593 RepID=A0A840SAX5_9BURK|nr:flagellar basal body P-ring formation chaperone FlgA [Inhella inkyongensis]MBB5205944.1 flagella basal body P-ring formation protein FlgA [Inhella inkyongensis]
MKYLAHCFALVLALVMGPAAASLPEPWRQALQSMTQSAAQAALAGQGEVVVELGELDARLRLAPCEQVQPFVPAGQNLWGRSRVGLRCLQGAKRWSITVPVQVRVFAPAWTLRQSLPAGTTLSEEMMERRRAEISAETSPALAQAEPPVGRVLAQAAEGGAVLRQQHLRVRQWFEAGAPVQLSLAGEGFSLRSEGQALGPGLEGATVRVRLESGRIVLGQASGPNRVTLPW